jgi:NADPH:quinone reductase-like Zn-dependent oxidoreductase
MKAIVEDRFGSPDVLQLREIDQPQVGDDEVLVRVQAASVNPADWYTMAGTPYVARQQESFGAEVTGVCSTRNVDLVGSLGADRVIDYTKEDFTRDPSPP